MDGWMDGFGTIKLPFGKEDITLVGNWRIPFLFFFWAVFVTVVLSRPWALTIPSSVGTLFCLLLSSLSMTTTPSIWMSTPSKLDSIFEKLNIKVFRVPFVHRKVKVYWDPPRLVEPNLSHRSLHRPPPSVPNPNFHCVACDCTFHSTRDMASHQCPPYQNAQKSLQRCWKKSLPLGCLHPTAWSDRRYQTSLK